MAQALKEKRLRVGLTQAQIAKKASITERGYRSYEASSTAKAKSIPNVLTAIKIAKALGTTVEKLWGAEVESEVNT